MSNELEAKKVNVHRVPAYHQRTLNDDVSMSMEMEMEGDFKIS